MLFPVCVSSLPGYLLPVGISFLKKKKISLLPVNDCLFVGWGFFCLPDVPHTLIHLKVSNLQGLLI